jgi:hypothetical protein
MGGDLGDMEKKQKKIEESVLVSVYFTSSN